MKAHTLFGSMILATPVLLSGCATGDRAPAADGAQRCMATGLDRNACARFANASCGGNFEVFEMDAPGDDGVMRRAYHFRCLP